MKKCIEAAVYLMLAIVGMIMLWCMNKDGMHGEEVFAIFIDIVFWFAVLAAGYWCLCGKSLFKIKSAHA